MNRCDIAVTGMGMVAPGGVGVEPNWQRVCAGTPTAALDPALAALPVRLSCRARGFDADRLLGARTAHHLDRFAQFALVAAREAVTDAGHRVDAWDGARVAVVIGTAGGGAETFETGHRAVLAGTPQYVSPLLLPMQLPNMVAGRLSMDLRARGPSLTVSTACASGATALATACDLLVLDRCDIAVAGGTEALLSPVAMTAFARMGALSTRHDDPPSASRPFDRDRDGFVAAEGAGILVLERTRDAHARTARIHARITGWGSSADAHHLTAPHPQGHGIERALGQALTMSGASPADVDHVNAHGTSTPLNDRIEGTTLARLLPHHPPVTSTKGVTGHLLGAAGAVEAIFTIRTLQTGQIPPTTNFTHPDPGLTLDIVTAPRHHPLHLALSNSFGFGGQNTVLALTR